MLVQVTFKQNNHADVCGNAKQGQFTSNYSNSSGVGLNNHSQGNQDDIDMNQPYVKFGRRNFYVYVFMSKIKK